MTCCVYWIHLPEHTDMTREGYIGISTNFKARMKDHLGHSIREDAHIHRAIRKYGWDNLIKEELVIASIDYCKDLEFKLRPKCSIGWNEIPGGDFSPSKNPEVAKKISEALKGRVGNKHTEESKARIAESNRSRLLSDESKKRISEAMRETQKKRILELKTKYTYLITHPDGKEETTNNLFEWCKANGILQSSMLRVANGKREQHKQYRCIRITN